MMDFKKALEKALFEDDADLLPEKEKRTLKAAKKMGIEEPSPDDLDEIDQEYYADNQK
jgi:hypothetical protein